MLGRTSTCYFRLDSTVEKILLSKLHKEIRIQSNIKIQIARRLFGLLNVKIQTVI